VEAGLFFANAERVRDEVTRLAAAPDTRAVLVDAETIPFVDVTAAEMLLQLQEALQRDGKRRLLAHDIGQVRDILALSESDKPLELYPTVREAVAQFESRKAA
jgi:anti-anti-sigma factor